MARRRTGVNELDPKTLAEEYAIDAMIPIMVSLRKLDVEGDVVSQLAVQRREYDWSSTRIKGPDRWGYAEALRDRKRA